jgi:glycosyltransferase involved in cell wall biosynthesis
VRRELRGWHGSSGLGSAYSKELHLNLAASNESAKTSSTTPASFSVPLRIAITADPEIPVPPLLYGGIERIVDMLVQGLVNRGHEVILFAHQESHVPCRLVPYRASSQKKRDILTNMLDVGSEVRRARVDVVHSFGRLAYLGSLLPRSIPKIMSYQRAVSPRSVALGRLLSRGSLQFTGCSGNLIHPWRSRKDFHVIYNGVPLSTYVAKEWVPIDAPLTYLGRIEEIKGVHLAIEVARRSKRRLVIAGNVPEQTLCRHYFEQQILPHLDGTHVLYMGPVGDREKNELLGQSSALLMPLLWDEPFGIVMAEALACGTPVIGLRRGSLPEIVEDGINGFICENVEEMVAAVANLASIDRKQCRKIAEDKFSDRVVVQCYEKLYRRLLQKPRNENNAC